MLSLAGAVCLLASGCAGFVDEITAKNFSLREKIHPPDPMLVLRTRRADGDAFAKAIHKIKEPLKAGRGQPEQDEVMQILTETATADPRPFCRLAAIDALGRFDDSRGSAVLMQAYQGASAFPSDNANLIRCAAMTSMGGKNTPECLALLEHVASTKKAPAASGIRPVKLEGDEELTKALGDYDPDAQAARDARITAVRALGKSKDPKAIPGLIALLDEKDVALHDRAHEALEQITGRRNVAATAESWRAALSIQSSPTRVASAGQ
jgi:HEAT repeat protein